MDGPSPACILRPIDQHLWAKLPGAEGGKEGFDMFVSEGLPNSRNVPLATGLTSLVVLPGALEAFTPRELLGAYEDFVGGEPQYQDAERGIKASAYSYDSRVLIVYEESETGSFVLFRSAS
jgi:hypothetical protein